MLLLLLYNTQGMATAMYTNGEEVVWVQPSQLPMRPGRT